MVGLLVFDSLVTIAGVSLLVAGTGGFALTIDDELQRNASSTVQELDRIVRCRTDQKTHQAHYVGYSTIPAGEKPMTMISRSLIALGLIGSGVAAALVTLRKARNKKDKREDEAAIRAWEGEGGSGSSSVRASDNVTYR